MHRTLSKESDPAPPVQTEVPDPPPPLPDGRDTPYCFHGWDLHCEPFPAPYHLQFREALIPDNEWYDIQSGPFDGSDISFVVSDERLTNLQEGVVFHLWRCLPGPAEGIRLFESLASLASNFIVVDL